MATAADDAAGKQFAPPAPGFAALYIFRAGEGPSYTITEGQRTLGVLGADTWLRVELAPGDHDLHCSVPKYSDLVSSAIVPLSSGNTVFLSAAIWKSGFSCHLITEDATVGMPYVLRGARVKDQP